VETALDGKEYQENRRDSQAEFVLPDQREPAQGSGSHSLPQLGGLIVWTAPPYRTEKIEISSNKDNNDNDSQSSEDKITYECDVSFPSSVFVITLIVLQALLLVFNCVVSFLSSFSSSCSMTTRPLY